MKVGELLRMTAQHLPKPEAETLLLAALGDPWKRFDLYSRSDEPVSEGVTQRVSDWTQQRMRGVPLQHLTGTQVFLEHEYQVSPDVLIPRPETEVLATTAIQELERLHGPGLSEEGWEVGLGSGILSIELLAHFPNLRMVASEVSKRAAEIALKNVTRILQNPNRLQILKPQDPRQVLEPFARDLRPCFVISNPPYLAEGSDELTSEVAQHEPALALYAPKDELLYFYERIAQQAVPFRGDPFRVFLELPHERAEKIAELFQAAGWQTRFHLDLHGRLRVLVAK
jgi:release factor glutamine methyltransferase